VNNPLRWCQR